MRMTALRMSLASALLSAIAAVPAAQAGPATAPGEAAFREGVRYEHAEGVARDYEKALGHYCRAAAAGNSDAMFALAWMHLNGRGVDQSDGRGVTWLKAAAEAGHATAPKLLARLGGIAAEGAPRCPGMQPPMPAAGGRLPLNPPAAYREIVEQVAAEYALDPNLVLAVMAVESAYRPDVVSHANAQGLMQLIPETAARFGVSDPFDPAQNIRGGARYLRWLLSLFEGDVTRTLAAYNAGENAVLRFGGIPPYEETQTYVVKIRRYYEAEHHPYVPGLATPPAAVVQVAAAATQAP